MRRKIIIMGAGTYGSYLAHCFAERYPADQIHLFEVGNENTQSESEIGFFSKVKGGLYKAASEGRFFGLGGTSARWGGQLLFFSNRDFSDDVGMREVIDCNIRFRDKVLSRFFKKVPKLGEKDFEEGLFVKQGIWLKYGQRNLFNHFRLSEISNVTLHKDTRVIRLNVSDGKICSIAVQFPHQEDTVRIEADLFYLTSGAFESLRLLDVSNILEVSNSSRGFSDHVSARCFEIHSDNATLSAHDLRFRFASGSMISSRLVGEIDNVSFYVHPIFNEDFAFFQFSKHLLFGAKSSTQNFHSVAKQIISIFPFLYSYLFKKELFILGKWYLNIDMESHRDNNFLSLSDELDANGQKGIYIQYGVSDDTIDKLQQVRAKVKRILESANVNFKELVDGSLTCSELQDVYHPIGLFSYAGDKNIYDVYNPVSNLYMFNTGLLYRSGGINPTASIFCLIEHHLCESGENAVNSRI